MRRHALAWLLIPAVAAGLSASLATPQVPGAGGPEFQVSQSLPPRYSYYYRFGPAADLADTGEFLVVWATYQGGGLAAMTGRAFDSGGSPQTAELDLGDGAIFHYFPESPDVAARGGQFVVVWSSYEEEDIGDASYSVKAQRFDLQGAPQGPRLKLSSGYGEFYGEVAVEPGGAFIVVWHFVSSARVRRFESTGDPSWPEKVVAVGASDPPDPDVAVDDLGNFTVVWSHLDISGPDAVFGRRYDSAGVLLDPTFAVSEFPSGSQNQPAIAGRPDGGFVAVWRSSGQDGSGFGVQGRAFDGAIQPIGGEFRVNATVAGFQEKPDVGADDRGNFVVVWQSGPAAGRGERILGQRFDAAGVRVGGEFLINETFTTGQRLPSIGMRDDGEFVVAWYSTQSACCTGGTSARARRFCATPNVNAPASLSVCEGDPATFDVVATGRQPFVHQWRRDALPLSDDGRVSGASSPHVEISPVEISDAGLYDCHVTDGCPGSQSLVSPAAQLEVVPRPAEVGGLTALPEAGGSMLRFTWTAAGGAFDYVVRADAVPGGGFTTVLGESADPVGGLDVPMPGGTQFFLVAGRNSTCGEGPLR